MNVLIVFERSYHLRNGQNIQSGRQIPRQASRNDAAKTTEASFIIGFLDQLHLILGRRWLGTRKNAAY